MASVPGPDRELTNRILAALPPSEFRRLEGTLERITAPSGQTLLEEGREPIRAYFPEDSVVSSRAFSAMVEVGLVGFDGVVGIHLLVPATEQPFRLIVQNGGAIYRLPLKQLRGEFAQGGRCRSCCCASRRCS